METRISVVVPAFNRHKEVEQALASVHGQQMNQDIRVEVVVVDDGSQPPLAPKRRDGLCLVRLPKNSGPAAARNAGIAKATGDYIAFLDSDDTWLPDKLVRQLSFVESSKLGGQALHAIVCGFVYPSGWTKSPELRLPREPRSSLSFFGGCWFCPGSTLFIHRSAFQQVGLFDENLRRLEDVDWFIRFGQLGGRISVVPIIGAIIIPSGSGGASVSVPIEVMMSKYVAGAGLSRIEKNNLQSYLHLERCAAALGDARYTFALYHLIASIAWRPRIRPALDDFWEKSRKIDSDIYGLYCKMLARSRA